MLELVADLAANHGKSLLYSSHLLADVERVCRAVLILGGGRVLRFGALDELVLPADESYTVRVRGEGFAAALAEEGLEAQALGGEDYRVDAPPAGGEPVALRTLRAVERAGLQLRAFRPVRSTLEEVFLAALGPGGSAPPPAPLPDARGAESAGRTPEAAPAADRAQEAS